MERFGHFRYKKLFSFIAGIFTASSVVASPASSAPNNQNLVLQQLPGFFRFNFDTVKMPNNIEDMGLLGINYFADLTPSIYGGIGGYGSVTGTQGGLFVLGIAGGIHKEFAPNWWADAGFFAGGGGGRSSLVGGGLMIRPHAGIQYAFRWARFGFHYSYIDFPSGQIRSSQLGLDLDIPFDFYYISNSDLNSSLYKFSDISLANGKFLSFQRNDFALLLQTYRQRAGTLNVHGKVQDGAIGVIGAELDHYFTDNTFWYVKAGGAFSGIPNGYMDVLGGFGYHWSLISRGFALVPQFGIGAGGGGNVDTGGGILVQPQLGFEWPFTSSFSGRVSGGYLWSPKGQMNAATATGLIIYHLDVATASDTPVINLVDCYKIQGWRIFIFNQTYLRPQRTFSETTAPINLIGLQIDQLFTPLIFFSYQAAFAYAGYRAGGYATGMIGPGIQTPELFNRRLQLFAEVLVGAGGGGNLALGGGSLIEPVVGVHYAITPAIGLQASVGQLKALRNDLNTPVINAGMTIRFGTLNRES